MKTCQICFLVFLIFFCNSLLAQNTTVQYFGKEKLNFYQINELLINDMVQFDSGNRTFKTNILFPMIYDQTGFQQPLILFPNDSIRLEVKNGAAIFSSFNNSQRDQEILCAKEIYDRYGSFIYEDYFALDRIPFVPKSVKNDMEFEAYKVKYPKTQKNNNARDSAIYSIYEKRMTILDKYKNSVSKEFYSLISNWLLYRYLYLSLKGYEYSLENSLPIRLRQLLSNKAIYDETLAQNINTYRAFLGFYNSYLTAIKLSRSPTPKEKLLNADTAFTGNNRDRIMFSIIYEHLQGKQIDSTLLPLFYSKCRNDTYVNRIKNYLKGKQLINVDAKSELLNRQKQLVGINDILTNKKGKLIYIDFWATWCGPCLAEMNDFKKLKKHYKEKNISFISISMDSDNGNWEKMLQNTFLDDLPSQNEHFLLINNFQSKFAKSFNIVSIPRFLLFDQTGKLISLKAPKPSDKDIYEFIDKLL
ncbi:TlpA family protein disulfide reductase [Niabella drilacis]|uniref:Redoxin n=1 Tax=Niabella drilacis (strain DSM 25811 / CCM 8410 / CCUG 62505 / LMG 26954 / E90) TaxID=1285928 RepID=A0A1G6ZM95_NIADE|nr:TlpA disulfide reductase family protein [Niabella drilacis]SDE02925.1 Redoxin [Niabella drilacis]